MPPNKEKINIVLLHGLAGSHRFFKTLEHGMQQTTGASTLSFDLLGFGTNFKNGKEYSLAEHLDFITEKITDRFGSEPIVLIGHSMGAILALAWTIKNQSRVKIIVLLNMPSGISRHDVETQIRQQKSGWSYLILAHRFIAFISCTLLCRGGLMTFFQFLKPDYIPREVFHDYTQHSWKSLSRSFRNIILALPAHELLDSLKTIPILNITGNRDSDLSRVQCKQPNVTNCEMEGGHYILLENPGSIVKEIEKFLALR